MREINGITCIDGTPVVSVAAWSNSGKTTFLEQVVPRLRALGITVGVVKHHAHTTPLDTVGKDSWRYGEAGASPVVVSSPNEYAIFRRTPNAEASLEDLCSRIAPECDLIVTEGFKREAMTKIEFSRVAHNPEPLFSSDEIAALITDNEPRAASFAQTGKPVFSLTDFDGFAAFLAGIARDHSREGGAHE